jgi:hypothetical protein
MQDLYTLKVRVTLIAAALKLLCESIEFQPLLICPPSRTGFYR